LTPTASRLAALRGADRLQHLPRRHRYLRTGAEDAFDASLVEIVVVLAWNHTTGDHADVAGALLPEFLDQRRYQCLVASGLGGYAHHVYIVFHRLTRDFFRCGEHG